MAEKAYWLKMQRKSRGLSQKELAELAGLSVRAVQSYEQGTRDISGASMAVLERLSRVLNCSVEELLRYPGYRRNPFAGFPDERLCTCYSRYILQQDFPAEEFPGFTGQEICRCLQEEMAERYYRICTEDKGVLNKKA